MFHFANDVKYRSFYYDQTQRHKIKQRLCSNSHYRAEPYQNVNITNFEVRMQNLSKEFKDCYQYNVAIKERNWGELRQKYIQCKIIKSIACGENTREQHFKKKNVDTFCNFTWDESNSRFSISITNTHYESTKIDGKSVSFLLGYLRCFIRDPMLGSKFYIDEPFKLIKNVTTLDNASHNIHTTVQNDYENVTTEQMESSGSTSVVILIVCFVCTVVAVLLLYQAKISQTGKGKSQS